MCGCLRELEGSSSPGLDAFDDLRGLRILLRKLELGFFIVGGSIMGGMCVRAVSRQGSRERDAQGCHEQGEPVAEER